MSLSTDRHFTGSIPDIYDRFMVPLLFEAQARDLAPRVGALAPQAVLETAAGTGVLTRALEACLPATTRLVATDLNPPMLALAASHQPAGSRVVWQEADALQLPFAPADFDLVVCQFGVMFFPDKMQGYREAHRVLRPGGHFLMSVWDGLAGNDFARVVEAALAKVFPQDPPGFMGRTPHGYHDMALIRAELAAAGFAAVAAEARDGVSRAGSAREVAMAFCHGTPLRNEIFARGPARLEEATACAAASLERCFGPGPIEGRVRAWLITAGR
ncbi:MAG: SAM-dependent methyltransferase [Belnapia sp.]|nr:SAM-dependent methyltransferase [Belnapia sp.]